MVRACVICVFSVNGSDYHYTGASDDVVKVIATGLVCRSDYATDVRIGGRDDHPGLENVIANVKAISTGDDLAPYLCRVGVTATQILSVRYASPLYAWTAVTYCTRNSGTSLYPPYIGFAAMGTALLHPTRRMDPPQSYPSNSLRAASASRRFMNDTKPLSPAFLFLLVAVMSAPGPCDASLRGHIILT